MKQFVRNMEHTGRYTFQTILMEHAIFHNEFFYIVRLQLETMMNGNNVMTEKFSILTVRKLLLP